MQKWQFYRRFVDRATPPRRYFPDDATSATVITCAVCGATTNEPGRKFCAECGSRLAVACPSCGTANQPNAKFCGECGARLGGEPATQSGATGAAAASPAAERRTVSVLFADLVGFTTISETRDPEDVRELLNGYFATCREIVERYAGSVEKFIGDAVMAVWGVPTAREDDAERAVRAALDLVDAVARLREQTGVPELNLRAGVLTGEAAVTLGAAGMGMVAGDIVNTASRLQSVAPPGSVLVGASTQRAASDAIAFEPAGEQLLKGKTAPVPAFRALRVVAKRGGVGRSDQLEPPFVGRDAELRLIKDFFHATARERGVRLVSVIGQAGIGKTRLAWEFHKYLDGLSEVVYWHQGRSPAYGDGVAFWSLGEMVRMRAGIGEGEDEATTRERLRATLEEFVPDAEERASLERPLLQLLGVEEGRNQERSQLFAAWRTFFERVADQSTVVMVFEDLQWADTGLLDFIEEMLAWSRSRPIYIITLARSELLDRRPAWGAGQRAFTSLSLAPLTDDEMRILLGGLLPGLPASVTDEIVGRAEGIPLYAVETVRMLLNDGRIERDGDSYRPVGDLSDLSVPESLLALIAARLDALPATERALLQDAAVLGLSFTVPSLAAVAQLDAADVEAALRTLVRRELVAFEDDPRSPERGQYRFVQALLREVAYGTLARRDRRTRHLAAARYFEALGDDELSGVLAEHYVDAYRAHPEGEEGAAVAAQARVALRAAAQRAQGLGSPGQAQRYLERALEVTIDPAEELELRMAAGLAALSSGHMEDSLAHFERARDLATQLGDAAARRRSIAAIGNALVEGHHLEAERVLSEAYDEPGLRPEDPGFGEIAEALAKVKMRLGKDEESLRIADRAFPALEASGDRRLALELAITRGVVLANLNRFSEAIITLTGVRQVADQWNVVASFLRASTNLGYAYEPEDPVAGYDVSRVAYERAQRYGFAWAVRYLLGNAAMTAIDIGDWAWAAEQVERQLQEDPEVRETVWFEYLSLTMRAHRGEDVHERVAEVRKLVEGFDDPQYLVLAMAPAVELAIAEGRGADLVRLAREAMELGRSGTDAAGPGVHGALLIGDLAAAREFRERWEANVRPGRRSDASRVTLDAAIAALEGRSGEARQLYADAQVRWRELGLRHQLALCQLELLISGVGEASERRRAAEEARAFWEGVGAVALLARLDEAAARGPVSAPSPSSSRAATAAARARE